MRGWLRWAVVWLLLIAQPMGANALLGLFEGGASGEATTVDGEPMWLESISLETPRDFDQLAPGEAPVEFYSAPQSIDFSRIQKIVFHELTTRYVGSSPDAMEYYRLGNVRNAVPPPPDWRRTFGQIPPWNRARAVVNPAPLPYLNHAVVCWIGPERAGAEGANEYLFRQAVTIDSTERIVRATLRLAGNVEILGAALNEHPLHLARGYGFEIAEYEVSALLRSGTNILALQVREAPGKLNATYGVGFQLELVERRAGAEAPATDPGAAILHGTDNGRIRGRVDEAQGDRVLLQTPYGRVGMEWSEILGLLFPRGWQPPPEEPRWYQVVGRNSPPPLTPAEPVGLPLRMQPEALQDRLLLTNGRVTTAKPAYARQGLLFFEGAEGKQYQLAQAEVLGIYPPRPMQRVFRRPKAREASIYCELTTTRDERFSGLLRQLNAGRILLEPSLGDFLEFDPETVATLHFPYHAPSPSPAAGKVALLTQAGGQEAYQEAWLRDAHSLQQAVFAIGAEYADLVLSQLAEGAPDPGDYPVIVSVDPLGEYPHTLIDPGDAQEALVDYIEAGGVLVVLSRGGALRTAVKQREGRLTRGPAELQKPSISEALAVETIRPTDEAGTDIEAFNHPPNTGEPVFFQRGQRLPQGLLGLPRQVTLASTLNPRFYPMVPREGQATVVYELRNSHGEVYGPALSLIARGQGMLVVIDHLLWQSRPEDRPFEERILPGVLRWLLDAGPRQP